ncbi:hypothetical protein [Dokdonella sp.]|uniref:hypothetical protein n=1 Tax=Dokdonella sp. TaxID=2291710 RepID=UPI001B1A1CC3|nr:hypothetical protein [Dokdonella sp.]MBO9661770.1 hypothetical protein [Dokdonella sp.]
MKNSIRLTLALAAGVIALPALADEARTLSSEAIATHQASVAKIHGDLARLKATRTTTVESSVAQEKAGTKSQYPGVPAPNAYRAYPPSCAADPLPDQPMGPTISKRVNLYARNDSGQARLEPVTITIWRIACSSAGRVTPYNDDGGKNAMTLLRIDRDSTNSDYYPTFPQLLISQAPNNYTNPESIVRAAVEPNTVISEAWYDSPVLTSTTYVLESYPFGDKYIHYYAYNFFLLVNPNTGNDSDMVEFEVPGYQPTQASYPDAFAPLPIDGYFATTWLDPAHSGEGMQTQVYNNPDGKRTFFASWYTYDPLGMPFWLAAQGNFNPGDASVTTNVTYQTDGGFAGDFLGTLKVHNWGTITFSFPNCDQMHFTYNGQTDAQTNGPGGVGTRDWRRIADVNGMNCE